MSDFNFDKFIKLMMMTTSDHDGECLNALRMANAELAKLNQNWEALLRGKVKIESSQASAPQYSKNKRDDDHIDEWFEFAFANTSPSSSFHDFLTSIHEWWEEKGFLTGAQYAALEKSVKRRRA